MHEGVAFSHISSASPLMSHHGKLPSWKRLCPRNCKGRSRIRGPPDEGVIAVAGDGPVRQRQAVGLGLSADQNIHIALVPGCGEVELEDGLARWRRHLHGAIVLLIIADVLLAAKTGAAGLALQQGGIAMPECLPMTMALRVLSGRSVWLWLSDSMLRSHAARCIRPEYTGQPYMPAQLLNCV